MTLEIPEEQAQSTGSFNTYIKYAAAGFAAIIFAPFLCGTMIAVATRPTADQVAQTVQVIRDVFIIVMALEGILIIMALTALILQVTRLLVMIQNEVTPIARNTQETLETAKRTTQFVGKNVAEPLIGLQAFLAGLAVFLRELFLIQRLIRRQMRRGDSSQGDADGSESVG